MPCYHPLTGFYAREVNDTGKRSIVFSADKALVDVPVQVPCGRCIGCRLDRSRDWALRCVHEASLYEANCFVTLTFDEKFIGDGSLKVSDFQNFMKRLRQKIAPQKVRFFHCGEYGAKFSRPHHHACLFGYDFPDKILFKSGVSPLYTSEILSSLWPFGFSTVGAVTFDSAAYVARYVMKKWSKDNLSGDDLYDAMRALSDDAYKALHYGDRHEEYITMSRKPGIGSAWYDKFSSDIYPSGFDILNGKKVPLPKFFDSRFELDNFVEFAKMKCERIARAQEDTNNSKARLAVREEVKLMNSKKLIRGFEDGY
ncbi:MAG: replication initiator protein [Arizlama microvirus]|nr:MAG: replication initiator protein [Arizlama microvirus]